MKRYRIEDENKVEPSGLKRVLVALLYTLVAFFACVYLVDAQDRWCRHHWHKEISPDGQYIAQYAYLSKETALVQIRGIKSGKLLAERTFFYGDAVQLNWGDHHLSYSTNDDSYYGFYDGSIPLPPRLFDRVAAYIP